MIYESTRMRTLCRWSRQSTQLQHTLHTGQASCAKRCRPGRQTTCCIGCAQLEHASSPPTCQRSIARMYAQSMTFFLYGIPYASMNIHALATVRAVHACAMHATERLCCSFSPSWKIGRGANGELPLCSLFVLRVCVMDPHGRNCCGLSGDVARRYSLCG